MRILNALGKGVAAGESSAPLLLHPQPQPREACLVAMKSCEGPCCGCVRERQAFLVQHRCAATNTNGPRTLLLLEKAHAGKRSSCPPPRSDSLAASSSPSSLRGWHNLLVRLRLRPLAAQPRHRGGRPACAWGINMPGMLVARQRLLPCDCWGTESSPEAYVFAAAMLWRRPSTKPMRTQDYYSAPLLYSILCHTSIRATGAASTLPDAGPSGLLGHTQGRHVLSSLDDDTTASLPARLPITSTNSETCTK